MAQHAKEGYEAAPLLETDAAAAELGQAPPCNKWHGHLLNPFGACDALGWSTCLITHYFPCVTFGVTNRRAFGKSALRMGLIFASLVAISYAHYAVQMAMVGNDCLADLPLQHGMDGPRRLGPGFGDDGHHEGAVSMMHTMTHAHLRCAKPFGRHIESAKTHGANASGMCMRLVHTSVLLNLATIVYTIALVIYGASLRTAMRERYGIEGSRFKDFLAWWCCMPCSMCQEARTMAVNNVEAGVWHGPSNGLPVYYAAAETDAPSVPVMSAEPVKPLKA